MSDQDTELRGVGGWLAFYLFIMGVISPGRIVVTTWTNLHGDPAVAEAYGPVWNTLVTVEWSLAAISIAGGWFVVWRMNAVQNWMSVKIAIGVMWGLSLGLSAAELVAVSRIAGIPMELLTADLSLDLARAVGFCLIWTAYLLKSVRVANTYGGLPREEVAEVFD